MAERYKRVFALSNNEYIDSSPVIIVAGALLLDDATGKVLAQLKFKSLSPKTIKGLRVNIYPFDAVNRPLGEPVVHDYLDLFITRDSEFGQKEGIELPDATTRAFTIEVTEVAFSDNSTWSSSGKDWQAIKEPVTLIDYFKDAELVKQYQIKFGNGTKVLPCQVCDLWICACGAYNHKNEDRCHSCGMRLNYLLSLDENSLASDKKLRVKREEYEKEKNQRKNPKIRRF